MENIISELNSVAVHLEVKMKGCKIKAEKERYKQRLKAVNSAIDQLKEQEPVPAREIKLFNGLVLYECGHCKTIVCLLDAFCHECGKPIKW